MENQKKKKPLSKRAKIGLGIGIAVVVLLVAALYYVFVVTNLGKFFLAQFKPDTPEQQLSFSSASDAARTIADEGFVLMQNKDGLLPLSTSADSKTKINLFGIRSISMVYNAGGSSASNVEGCVKLEDALQGEHGNFEVNPDLLYLNYNFYKSGKVSIQQTSAPENKSASEFIEDATGHFLPEVSPSAYNDTSLYGDGRTIIDHAYDYSDIAMVVIGRSGGEVYDFTPAELRLSDDEAAMMDAICAKFEKVILIINSANAMEMQMLKDYPQIKSVVWVGYPGQTGVESLARILNGTVNPSGHLADTWLYDTLANPATNNYLPLAADGSWDPDAYHYTNAPKEFDYTVQGSTVGHFVQYSEGIYVGYKYFESRHDTDSSYDYDADVAFPFGYGLSYTTFEKNLIGLSEENGVITVRVEVTNTGKVAGKDVIEIYYNPPYTGAIEKSTVNLVAFKKTNEIAPGETEYYSLEFNVEDMASYDADVNKSYVLEKGDYVISLRDDAHTVVASESYVLDRDIIYNDEHDGKRSTDLVAATNLFDDALGVDDYLTRSWDQTARAFTGPQAEDYTAPDEVIDSLVYAGPPTDAELGLTEADMPNIGVTLATPIMLSDMKDVPKNDPKWDDFVSQLTLEEMCSLAGSGAWQINEIERLGVPRTLTPDGSTTVTASLYAAMQMGTAGCGITYPTPVVVASFWNPDIAYLMGTSVANEAKAYGYAGWYAPAMNTHRVPFNGRNFEYYSEDGVLAGATASNVIRAATENGIMCFMKHFALNDRETSDRQQLFTWADEQAMREIYLRPFEAAVKSGGTLAAMSSFNYIGSTWAGGNPALLKDLLRGEWGFEGLVITDANLYGYMNPVQMIYNGGDLSLDVMAIYMGGAGHGTQIQAAAEAPATRIGATRSVYGAAKNILFAVSRTWAVE